MARNHRHSGRWVEAKIVPAIGEVWRRQALVSVCSGLTLIVV
jgi:hypothetical protein